MERHRKAVLLNSTTSSNHLGCYLTSIGLRRLLTEANINVVFESDVNQSNLEFVESLLVSDPKLFLVINGEGTFHDNQVYAVRLLKLAAKFSNPKLLLNSQFKNMEKKFIDIVKDFDLVQVRTKTDHEYVLGSGVTDAIYCPDMLFYSGVSELNCESVKGGVIVITDSHVTTSTAKLYRIFSQLKTQARWLNFHFYPAGQPTSPSVYKRLLATFLSKTNLAGKGYKGYGVINRTNASGLLGSFASARGVVSGRYHGVCLAIALKRPVLYGETNTSKIVDLCKDFGVGEPLENWGDDLSGIDWGRQQTDFDSVLLSIPYSELLSRLKCVAGNG